MQLYSIKIFTRIMAVLDQLLKKYVCTVYSKIHMAFNFKGVHFSCNLLLLKY